MALAVWQATIVNEAGDIQPNAQVEVRLEATGALAAIYSDRDGANVLTNPFQADSSGFARFYAAGGSYRIDASLGDLSITWRHVPVGLLGEADYTADLLQTAAEITAGVTPTNYSYPPGDVRRYGATGDGVTDDLTAINDALAAASAGGYLVSFPAGKFRITDEIVWPTNVKSRGVGDFWNPSATRDTWIYYDGTTSANKAVIRASTKSISTSASGEPTSALSNIKIENMLLDANSKAGYGLFAAYCTNESVFDQITVVGATEHGMIFLKCWYIKPGRLTARNCPGRGVTIGDHEDFVSTWSETSVNGVFFPDIRVSSVGTAFTSTGTAWDESTDIQKGYGVGFFPRSMVRIGNATVEHTRGAGVVYGGSSTGPSGIDAIYLESCCDDENGDEWTDSTERWGLIVQTTSNSRGMYFGQVYLGAANDSTKQSLWITGDAPTAGPPVFQQILHGDQIVADSTGIVVLGGTGGIATVGGTSGYGTLRIGGKVQAHGGEFAYGLVNPSLAYRTKAAQDIDFLDNSATTLVSFSVPNPGSSRGIGATATLSVTVRAFEDAANHQTQTVPLIITLARTADENTAVGIALSGTVARSVDGSPSMTTIVVGDFSSSISGGTTETQTVSIRLTKSHGVSDDTRREVAYHGQLMNSGASTPTEDIEFA